MSTLDTPDTRWKNLMGNCLTEFKQACDVKDLSEDTDVSATQASVTSPSTTDTGKTQITSDVVPDIPDTAPADKIPHLLLANSNDSFCGTSFNLCASTGPFSRTEDATKAAPRTQNLQTSTGQSPSDAFASDGTYAPSVPIYTEIINIDTDESSTEQENLETSLRSETSYDNAGNAWTELQQQEPQGSAARKSLSSGSTKAGKQGSTRKEKKKKRRKLVTRTPSDGWVMFKEGDVISETEVMAALKRQPSMKKGKRPFNILNPFKSPVPSIERRSIHDSEICADHLRKQCLKKSYCKSLHFKNSFLWVKCLSGDSKTEKLWLALHSCESKALEKTYQDPMLDESIAIIDDRPVSIDFENMLLTRECEKSAVMRLSTPSATSIQYDDAHTVWIWYYQHTQQQWRPMKRDNKALMLSLETEAVLQEGATSFKYEDLSMTYVVNLKDMTRQALSSGVTTKVKRRPLYKNKCPTTCSDDEVYLYQEKYHQRLSSICIQYLEGGCSKNKCKSVHSFQPYQWFWVDKCKELHMLHEDQNMELERQYCDPANTTAILHLESGSNKWQADFESMKMTSEPGRLIRASAPAAGSESFDNLECHAVWIWYWKENDDQWKPYPETGEDITCHQIEQCFQKKTQILEFKQRGYDFKLDLNTMTQVNVNTGKVRGIRRRPKLASSRPRTFIKSEAAVGMEESEWIWSWKDDDDIWVNYPEQATQQSPITSPAIERGFQSGRNQLSFQMGNFQYKLDLVNNVQINKQTGKRRALLREKKRPKPTQKSMMYPSHWKDIENYNSCCRVEIDEELMDKMDGDDLLEIYTVIEIFSSTLPSKEITLIESLQNNRLYHDFTRKREKLQLKWGTDDIEERLLFHGTDKENVDDIIKQGFDFRLAGSATGTLWGRGAYFARDAAYSDAYTPNDTLLVANVLIGKTTLGKKDIPRPPEHSEGRLYDSCVNNETDPTIYVIFDLDQSYPAYLIKYRNK